ncbi:unnamed protein product [Enterobius vermicularis]|uniref:PPM-type phosphatase domain-containing protein n=1 Tax=Enterobius vermicularis TaxID=51028 RepID=A0A0N4VRB9_ENTVE|nr:unnamed protein product [Enterobius vermicularis]
MNKAFGDTALKRCAILTATPDVVFKDLTELNLRFILVASDGFWDVISNDDAVRIADSFLRNTPHLRWQSYIAFSQRKKKKKEISI